MVSRFQAVKLVGSRTTEEKSSLVTMGGISNTPVLANYVVYQIKLIQVRSRSKFNGIII